MKITICMPCLGKFCQSPLKTFFSRTHNLVPNTYDYFYMTVEISLIIYSTISLSIRWSSSLILVKSPLVHLLLYLITHDNHIHRYSTVWLVKKVPNWAFFKYFVITPACSSLCASNELRSHRNEFSRAVQAFFTSQRTNCHQNIVKPVVIY